MTKVFVGGSRKISRLSKEVKARIDNIIAKEYTVLVGDANGIDKSTQEYLADKNYRKVVVFCSGMDCRNNVGSWDVERIEVINAKKDFAYYSAKDLEMTKRANYGFMIWDGKSRGTLSSIVNLLKGGKKILVYFVPRRLFLNVITSDDLAKLLNMSDTKHLPAFDLSSDVLQPAQSEEQHEFEWIL